MENTRTEIKRLPGGAVYSDVIDCGLVLPYKAKYTISDFRKLVSDGWSQLDARFIVVCSCVHYIYEGKPCGTSKRIESGKFLDLCKLGIAIM